MIRELFSLSDVYEADALHVSAIEGAPASLYSTIDNFRNAPSTYSQASMCHFVWFLLHLISPS